MYFKFQCFYIVAGWRQAALLALHVVFQASSGKDEAEWRREAGTQQDDGEERSEEQGSQVSDECFFTWGSYHNYARLIFTLLDPPPPHSALITLCNALGDGPPPSSSYSLAHKNNALSNKTMKNVLSKHFLQINLMLF